MCDPVSALMVGGTAIQGVSQFAAGQAGAAHARFQAGDYEIRKKAIESKALRDSRLRLDQANEVMKANIGAMAFSSVAMDQFDHVLEANRRKALDDVRQIMSDGEANAYAAQAQADDLRFNARMKKFSGIMSAAATFVGGALDFSQNAPHSTLVSMGLKKG